MGRKLALSCALALAICATAAGSPRVSSSFVRSAVETIPRHDPLSTPIRSSVESVPLRFLSEDSEGRLPLRDAVEKRPIAVIDRESHYKFLEDSDTIQDDFGGLKHYYGAALHLNNGSRNDERLQLGNANLQEMQQTSGSLSARRLVVCYLQSWAAYRAPPLAFTAGLLPKSCSHLHYAFAVLHPHTYAVLPANEDYDVIKGGYRIATGLKRRIPGLKVLISVGGDGTARLFSEMVQEPVRRNSFIESAVSFLQEHDFDGLDLHWVYPGEKDERERELLTSLIYELREKFSSYGFLLSTVLPPFRYQIEDGYDLSAVSGATDYTILQAWDMTHGKRDEPPSRAVQHSALHRDPGAASRDQRYDNIEFMVKYVLRHGMAAEKLVLGIPLFGRSYTLAASTLPAPGAQTNGWGEEGPYTQTKGMLSYFEICMKEREGKGVSGIDEAGNAYAVFDNQWVTYDTPATVLEKMKFVITSGLAGAAAWSVDMDDFRGLCGSSFPLLSTISSTLNEESVSTDQSSLKLGSCESEDPYLASDEESCAHFHFCSGGISYRLICEEQRLYDPSTGFCGHQDVGKCMPGQSLRISVEDAARYLTHVYENDFEWNDAPIKDNSMMSLSREPERFTLDSDDVDIKRGPVSDKKIVCYMTSWAFYRRGDGKFVPERIDSRLCTHIVYAYASLSPVDLIAKEFDPWTDITNNMYERVTSLKDVKVLLGLGGWTDSAGDKYSRLVSSGSARAKFIQKLIPFLRMHNFKGLHLDWNYPVCWQSNCKKGAVSDKANYAKFVQELAKALHEADMELGVAISGYKEVIESAYDFPIISREADFLSTMTYDYHGGWERTTAHHTPLIPSPKDSLAYYSIEYAIKAIISGGADPKKLLLGLSFYGQSYRLADVTGDRSPGCPAAGPGEPGEFTKQPGMLAYYEICYRVKNLRWKTGRQENAGPYTYSDNQWVGYDDPKSITEKVEWAMRQGLGGVSAWAIDLDDFNNRCCNEPSPLLRAAGRALGRAVPVPPTTACERPPDPVTPAPPTTTPMESDGSMAGGGGGDHNHGNHDHSTTTWPSWTPAATQPTTQMTWWAPASTTTSTTTTTKPTTTTRPTTQRPMATKPSDSGLMEGGPCRAGEYHADPGDCEGYLQCEGGQWRKQFCAPGLHWAAAVNRCDWPSFAKCTATSISESSTATSTLAPMTSRPPPRPTTTTTTTTTTKKPTTTTTTTTTARPTRPSSDNQGSSCTGEEYKPAPGDCNAYLHCDGNIWRLQHCAPGLHWSATQKHCDWPKYAKCEGSAPVAPKPTTPSRPVTTTTKRTPSDKEENRECGGADIHAPSSSCDSYLICVGGKWRKQMCPPGLHWDKRTSRCDWVEFAMCEVKPSATKSPILMPRPTSSTTTTTTRRSTTSRRPPNTTRKPIDDNNIPSKGCITGGYHSHPKCEKFYVCVNDVLISQSCAPGLVWRQDRTQCDFPSSSSCTDRRQGVSAPLVDASNAATDVDLIEEPSKYCNNGEYASLPHDCSRYQHCLFGKFQEFTCSAGLHWNQERQICDWPKNAKCKKVSTTTTSTSTTTFRPVMVEPEMPDDDDIIAVKPIHTVPSTGTQPDIPNKPALLKSQYKLVCYYTNWSWYRPGIGKYSPEDIDPSLCTHIVYGFAVLGDDELIMAHDSWADYDHRFYERVVEFKRYGIKVSLAIGGWNDSAGDKYSRLVNNPTARARFVRHVVTFLEKFGFDGLDLDWEYPKCWQVDCSKGPDSDKQAFSDFVRELSAVFKPKGLLLSAAVSPSKMVIDAGYDVRGLAENLDWIAVMTYDYHGQWDKKTGHVAPLYYHPDDDNTYFNANYTMHYWIKKGAPPSKLVMGFPMYGQTFTLNSYGKQAGLNTPAISGGEEGEYTRAKGFLAYYEICDRIRYNGWTVVKDPKGRMGPYAFKDDQWVSFDDAEIIKRKVDFVKYLDLAGAMVWAMDLDDFRNRCGEGKHPLMNAIKNRLLDSRTSDIINSDQIFEPMNSIDDDLDDIQVRPGDKPVKPLQDTESNVMETTKRPTTTVINNIDERYKVICYYTNWAWYRPGSGKFTPSEIDPSLCTHIVYAFAVLDSSRLVFKPHDIWLDVENKFYEKVAALKSEGVKVVLGLGGWDDSASDKYSRLVNSVSARRTFIVHAIDFIEQYEFDGLDLDWEYPRCWQVNCEKGPSTDKEGFANLVKELKAAFAPRGLSVSAGVSASKKVIDLAYDVPTLTENLDWISLMAYDYHGQWDKKTGHVAPMYANDYDQDMTLNTNFSVSYWISKGANREKLILGVPFYGQSFSLMDNVGTGLGAPTYAGGEAGDETRARGFLSFYEICDRIRVKGWQVTRDPGGRMGPYAALDDQWVSFDDDYMIRHKSEYVRAMGLGGAMAWAIDLDDFSGKYCACGKYPLLSTINYVLRNKEILPPCSLEEIHAPESATAVAMPGTTMETVTIPQRKPESESGPAHDTEIESGSNLDGSPCSGNKFTADSTDCSKYYLCINGKLAQLTCPEPLHWNRNHCDWPEKSQCKLKGQLRHKKPLSDNDEETEPDKPIIACYFTSWAYYRQGNGSFGPEQVNPSLCTHIVYSWAHLDNKTYTVVPGDPELDIENDFYGKITELRQTGVKVILGLGGLKDSEGEKWNQMVSTRKNRRKFVSSVQKYLQKWNFDGIQIAWQYPVCKQAPCSDTREDIQEGFTKLISELSKSLRSNNLELSVMVATSPEIASVAYKPDVFTTDVDWVAIAANDYLSSSTGRTTFLVPLKSQDIAGINGFNATINYWTSLIPAGKLVLNIPAYGRSYTLRSSSYTEPGAPILGPGEAGPYTAIPGFLAYYEICKGIKSMEWNQIQTNDGTYSVREDQWSSYLRPEEVYTIGVTTALAKLRGAGLWAIDLDDWRGECACPQPLLTALRQGLLEPSIPLSLCQKL